MRLRSNIRAAEDALLQMRVLEVENLIMLPQVSQADQNDMARKLNPQQHFKALLGPSSRVFSYVLWPSLLGFIVSVC